MKNGEKQPSGNGNNGYDWDELMKNADVNDDVKLMDDDELQKKVEKREKEMGEFDKKLKQSNDEYADAMAVRNAIWERMGDGELSAEDSKALFEAEETLAGARNKMDDLNEKGMSSEYFTGKTTEENIGKSATLLDELESEMNPRTSDERIVDTGIMDEEYYWKVMEKFRDGLVSGQKQEKVEANKKAGTKMGALKRVILSGARVILSGALAATILISSANLRGGVANAANARDTEPKTSPDTEQNSEAEKSSVDYKLNLKVGAEQEKQDESTLEAKGSSYGEAVEYKIEKQNYSGTSSFFDYENKRSGSGSTGRNSLTTPLYAETAEQKTDKEKAAEMAQELWDRLDDEVMQTQFCTLSGTSFELNGQDFKVKSLGDMNTLSYLLQSDDEFRASFQEVLQDEYKDMLEKYDAQVGVVKKGTLYNSLYAEEGEASRIRFSIDDENSWDHGVTAAKDFEVLKFMDGEQNILDSNEIDGFKYNFLVGIGKIPENASDEEALAIMEGIEVLGISGECGQVIWKNISKNKEEITEKKDKPEEEITETDETKIDLDEEIPSGSEPSGSEPSGSEPSGSEPSGVEPSGVEPSGVEPSGVEPSGVEPSGTEPGDIPEKTETIDDEHNPELGETEVEDNEGVVEQTEDNDGTDKPEGSEVTEPEKDGRNNDADEADNAYHPPQEDTKETGDQNSGGGNEDRSDNDLGDIFKNL